MLTRAISAPAQYGAPGILRYSPESVSPVNSNVKFAPLPQTEVFGRRARFSSRLGVQGRSGILNKQRQHPNGINYDPNNIINEATESTSQDDAASEPNGHDATHGTTPHQASETASLHPPLESDPSLNLRRSASEDGTAATSTSKRGSSLKFWKKPSKRPTLSTIHSGVIIQTPNSHASQPQTTETAALVGPCGVPAAPIETTTPLPSAESNQQEEATTKRGENTTVTTVEVSDLTSTPTITTSLHSPTVSTSSIESTNATLNAMTETPTEEYSGGAGVRFDGPSDGASKSEMMEPLEVSIHLLDEKVAPSIVAV